MKANVSINLAGEDKFSSFLMSLKGKKRILAIFTAMGICIIPVLFTFVDGNFYSHKEPFINAARDYGKISVYLLGLPLALLVLTLYSGKFPGVLEQLEQNSVIIMTDKEWSDFKSSANRIIARGIFTKTPYLIAFLITLYLIYKSTNYAAWYSIKSGDGFYSAAYLQIPVYYLTFYAFSLCLLNIIASYVVLRNLFNNYKISLQPLHPDNCGGLSSLGDLSKKLNVGIIILGVISALNVYRDYKILDNSFFNTFHLLIIAGYIVCAFVVFFMPLYAAHESMKKAKFEEIKRINDYFLTVNKKLKNHINNHENIDQRDMDDFENINKIYDLAKKMPVYPFNIATVTSFIGSIFIPVILFLIEKVFEMLL